MIPDIGGAYNRYFEIKPRAKWVESFVSWLRAPHELNDLLADEESEASDKEDEKPGEEDEEGEL